MEDEKNKLLTGNKSIDKKLKEYDILKNNLEKILCDKPENNLENTQTERQEQQQKQIRKNKDDIQI